MTERKWIMYEMLKELAGKVIEISQGGGEFGQQHEKVCAECEKVADRIYEQEE